MAKIFKVSGYLVDVDGDFDVSEVLAEVSFGLDGMIRQDKSTDILKDI